MYNTSYIIPQEADILWCSSLNVTSKLVCTFSWAGDSKWTVWQERASSSGSRVQMCQIFTLQIYLNSCIYKKIYKLSEIHVYLQLYHEYSFSNIYSRHGKYLDCAWNEKPHKCKLGIAATRDQSEAILLSRSTWTSAHDHVVSIFLTYCLYTHFI